MALYGISFYGSSLGQEPPDIKNLALFLLGVPDEIDFNDATSELVQKVNRIYGTTLLACLSGYSWRFIRRRIEITSSQVVADDTDKYKYNYTTPVNMLTIRNIFTDPNYQNPIRQYESYPKYINTDAAKVFLWYQAIVDEVEFPKYFVDYFKYKLAVDLCFNLTGDGQLEEKLIKEEQFMLSIARNIDAKQDPTRIVKASPFTQIRG